MVYYCDRWNRYVWWDKLNCTAYSFFMYSWHKVLKHLQWCGDGPTYQPFSPWKAHDAHLYSFASTIVWVHGGARGILLKTCTPFRYACANSAGLTNKLRRRFNVISTWSNNQSDLWIGNFRLQVARPCFSLLLVANPDYIHYPLCNILLRGHF